MNLFSAPFYAPSHWLVVGSCEWGGGSDGLSGEGATERACGVCGPERCGAAVWSYAGFRAEQLQICPHGSLREAVKAVAGLMPSRLLAYRARGVASLIQSATAYGAWPDRVVTIVSIFTLHLQITLIDDLGHYSLQPYFQCNPRPLTVGLWQ